MSPQRYSKLVTVGIQFFVITLLSILAASPIISQSNDDVAIKPKLLTDPFLQLPTENSVRVVWFTEFMGQQHFVTYGDGLGKQVEAITQKLSRMYEDQYSRVGEQVENGQVYKQVTARDIWRHEATISGLQPGERLPYYVTSVAETGQSIESDQFTLAPLPQANQPLKILLTSDHQLKPMVASNLQKVVETVDQVDAVFFAGDLINVPDRASEWFDHNQGLAFFPNLQGRTQKSLTYEVENSTVSGTVVTTYTGGALIQSAPLFPVIGNHEVMGRFNPGQDLNTQFNDPHPRSIASQRYDLYANLFNPLADHQVEAQWLQDNSFNSRTYEEIFTLPNDGPAGEQYYAMQFGDIYLISLYATRIWRSPQLNEQTRGKYREAKADLNKPDDWGYGEFIFEDLAKDSTQYNWLVRQLNQPEFKSAPYKTVMLHHPIHSIGDNVTPAYAHPVQIIDRHEDGTIAEVRYEYPLEDDILVRDIVPLLEEAGVNLLFYGHSHVWYRFKSEAGTHYLETSNVGNSYGCYLADGTAGRGNAVTDERYNRANYSSKGNPYGLKPITPTLSSPQRNEQGQPLPCLSSNEITIFTILDTGKGTVSSYFFDTRHPNSAVMKFDEFSLLNDQ